MDQLARFCGVENCPDVATLARSCDAIESDIRRSGQRARGGEEAPPRPGKENLFNSIEVAGAACEPPTPDSLCISRIEPQSQSLFQDREFLASMRHDRDESPPYVQASARLGELPADSNSPSARRASLPAPPLFNRLADGAGTDARPRPPNSQKSIARPAPSDSGTLLSLQGKSLRFFFTEERGVAAPEPAPQIAAAPPLKSRSSADIGKAFSIVAYPSRGEKLSPDAQSTFEVELEVDPGQVQGWLGGRSHQRDLKLDFVEEKDSVYTFYDYEEQLGELRRVKKQAKDALELLDFEPRLAVRLQKGVGNLRDFGAQLAEGEGSWWRRVAATLTCGRRG